TPSSTVRPRTATRSTGWSRALGLLLPVLLGGCAVQRAVLDDVHRTESVLLMAQDVYASLCAPADMADAEAHLDFTRVELHQGDTRRASQHVALAYASALAALEVATPCGSVDRDNDRIPDIVD